MMGRLILLGVLLLYWWTRRVSTQPSYLEIEHNPLVWQPKWITPYVNGSQYTVPSTDETPDFRWPEPPFLPRKPDFYYEIHRPYRLSPYFKQVQRWANVYNGWTEYGNKQNPWLMGCYCCTVYKRITLLAGCAVITTRHILTTASSTELILKHRKRHFTLENILGAWYDHNANVFNSTLYMTPARIHFHPSYMRSDQSNGSHPFPVMYDLSVWVATYRFYGYYLTSTSTLICSRASSSWWDTGSPTPGYQTHWIIGFQFMWNWKKVPMPWYKYGVRTHGGFNIIPCPKTEWGWFFCVGGKAFKLGIDNGAALHRCNEGQNWRYDGLVGLNAISMRLRYETMAHYFTVLDRHTVLDFLYHAYKGMLPSEYVDGRFYDTKYDVPRPKPGTVIYWSYDWGVEYDLFPSWFK